MSTFWRLFDYPVNLNAFWGYSPFLVQGYRRLSVDIEAMRDTRREVREKWKTILENLGGAWLMRHAIVWEISDNPCWDYLPYFPGFMAEADSLLAVSAGGSHDRMRNAPRARALLHTLHSETSIFNSNKEPPPERYLFILVRKRGLLVGSAPSLNFDFIQSQINFAIAFWLRFENSPVKFSSSHK